MWIDTHAHLADELFKDNIAEVLDRAQSAGVERIIVIGTDLASSRRAVELAQAHDLLRATVGIHPNHAGEARPGDFEAVVELAGAVKVVGIGETGLDRYWDTVPIGLQREFFMRHLELGHAAGKPVVIHCRQAESDVLEALASFTARFGGPIAGVMHSFTADLAVARQCLAHGLMISFAGMLTYKKNDSLRAVAAELPLDCLLVETDSPYLSPEPFRGKPNEPARVVHTGQRLAAIRAMPIDELATATTRNAKRVFGTLER